MVNANIIISVSAVLVALILTIVIVMRQAGDPADNYSVSVVGTYSKDATTFDAAMYFCTGNDCQFHGKGYDGHENEETFPGYYALVGFTTEGKTYVTEHSIGKTFVYTGEVLTSCHDSTNLDTNVLAERISALTAAWTGGKTFTIEGGTFTMATYDLDADPSDDTPSVLGKGVPTLAECRTVWGDVDHAMSSDPDTDFDATKPTIVGERRRLWGGGDNHNAHTLSMLASFAYDGNGLPGGWTYWALCQNSNSVARFAYAYPTMVIAYAGTNDMWDALQDMKTWGNDRYHGGFHDYVGMTRGCVDNYVNMLRNWGIEIDYITGHSLGGAAAVVYKQTSSAGGRVVTFGAPKTSRYGGCKSLGTRIFHEKDPVASNGLGIMGAFSHDVSSARRTYESSYCSSSWWGMCTGWSTARGTNGAGCWDEAGGCAWFFDCLWNVGNHNLNNYQNFNLGSVGV